MESNSTSRSVSMPETLWDMFDEYCDRKKTYRSPVIQRLVINDLIANKVLPSDVDFEDLDIIRAAIDAKNVVGEQELMNLMRSVKTEGVG